MPFSPNAIALLLIALIALGALVLFVYRWTISRQADYAAVVRESDVAFQRIAKMLGLTFASGRIMHHPVIGDIAAFGTVQGLYRDFQITLQVISDENTEPPVVFRAEITLYALSGTTFVSTLTRSTLKRARRYVVEPTRIVFEPEIVCRARSMSYELFVMTDVATLRTALDEVCDLGESLLQ